MSWIVEVYVMYVNRIGPVFAARCYASAALAVTRCLCVCLCVQTFVGCVKTNKHIFKLFSLSGSHTILVFLYQTAWQYFDGNACGVLSQYLTSSHAVNATTASCYQRDCRPIPGYRSMPAGASAINWRWSVQWCITDCHGASLFTAQKATHQWIRRREEKRT